MTPAEFVTARWDEEEEAARAALGAPGSGDFSWWDVDYNSAVAAAHGAFWKPEHVLADIAAKRAVLAFVVDEYPYVADLFAEAYADHPDFDPTWRDE